MTSLEKGKDKIDRICQILRQETLEPAQVEAQKIIQEAHQQAKKIIQEAEKESASILEKAKENIRKEQAIFEASLNQACQQSLQFLKQEIEKKLFSETLDLQINEAANAQELVAKMITVVLEAIEKEGLSSKYTVYLSKRISQEQILQYVNSTIVELLKKQSVEIGHFEGGLQVKLKDKQITLDLTDKTLKELIGSFLKPSFRNILFSSN